MFSWSDGCACRVMRQYIALFALTAILLSQDCSLSMDVPTCGASLIIHIAVVTLDFFRIVSFVHVHVSDSNGLLIGTRQLPCLPSYLFHFFNVLDLLAGWKIKSANFYVPSSFISHL